MSTPFAFDAYVIDKQEEQEKLQAYGEYRAHGGTLDITEWEEKLERHEA